MDEERRRTLRVPFVAYAEITEAGTEISIGARVSDISKDGCYVDLRSAFPKGTSVQIKIKTATEFFEASAVVGYTHLHLGMGLIFSEVKFESEAILQRWIASVGQR
jgi:PilZ domain